MTAPITDDQIRHVAASHFLANDASLHAIADRALGDLTAVPDHDRIDGPPTTDECRASMAYYRSQFSGACAHCRGPSDLSALGVLVDAVKQSYKWRGRPSGDCDQRALPRIFRRTDGRQFVVASARRMLAVAAIVLIVGLGACMASTDAATDQQTQESVVCGPTICYPYTAEVYGVPTPWEIFFGVDPSANAGCHAECGGHCVTDFDVGGGPWYGLATAEAVAAAVCGDNLRCQAAYVSGIYGTCEGTFIY